MSVLIDDEFGEIVLRRSAKASSVRIRIAPDGRLRASLPVYAPIFLVKRLLKTSRAELREIISQHHTTTQYIDGMQIGKSHTLAVRGSNSTLSVSKHGQRIIVSLPIDRSLNDTEVATKIRQKVGEALRSEAKSYLPRRLRFLADQHNFKYEKVRFSHASGRWGSCSSNGTISLNIALMKLPFELIDYVLVHELCHTVHMNHSHAFWSLVETVDHHYKTHKHLLGSETPAI